jgi:clan AA aspartic protease
MGVFWQTLRVGNPEGGDSVEIEAMVDTGAADSMFPEYLLKGIRLQPVTSHMYSVADGRTVRLPYGNALITIGDATWPCPVIFGPSDDALLGATTLEIFKLIVDPNTQSLLPANISPLGGGSRAEIRP